MVAEKEYKNLQHPDLVMACLVFPRKGLSVQSQKKHSIIQTRIKWKMNVKLYAFNFFKRCNSKFLTWLLEMASSSTFRDNQMRSRCESILGNRIKEMCRIIPGITLTWIPCCCKKSISSPPLPNTFETQWYMSPKARL